MSHCHVSAKTQKIHSIKKVTVFMHDKPMGSSNKQEKNIVNVEELHCTLSKNSGLLSISEYRT